MWLRLCARLAGVGAFKLLVPGYAGRRRHGIRLSKLPEQVPSTPLVKLHRRKPSIAFFLDTSSLLSVLGFTAPSSAVPLNGRFLSHSSELTHFGPLAHDLLGFFFCARHGCEEIASPSKGMVREIPDCCIHKEFVSNPATLNASCMLQRLAANVLRSHAPCVSTQGTSGR